MIECDRDGKGVWGHRCRVHGRHVWCVKWAQGYVKFRMWRSIDGYRQEDGYKHVVVICAGCGRAWGAREGPMWSQGVREACAWCRLRGT